MSLISNTKTEGQYAMDWLLMEEDEIGRFSREAVLIEGGSTYETGTVLMDGGAGYGIESDGSGTFLGIVVDSTVDAAAGNRKIAVLARKARIDLNQMPWFQALGTAEQDLIKAQLIAADIVFTPNVDGSSVNPAVSSPA